ncbi:hypothetical protein Tco_0512379, partial [Tanacetum coccineum]
VTDNEDDVSAVKTVSPVKTNETQTVRNRVDKIGQISQKEGIVFKKLKACFVCKSTDHLIKDCNFYDKKSPEPKLKTVGNTGQKVIKPVWDNAKRVNQFFFSNNLKYPQARRTFVPSGVLTKTGLVNPVRPNGKRAVHTVSTARPISTARPVSIVRPFAPKIAQTSGAIRPIYPRMFNVRPRGSYSPIKRSYYTKPAFRPKDLKQDVKTFGVQKMTTAGTRAVVNTGKGKMDTDLKKSRWVWRPKRNYLDHVSNDSGSFMLKKDHAVVDSGCSSHMTGNKAYLSDYKDYNGGSSLDRKSTTATNCCGQVLGIQNQMMDYGFNFMNTKIHIDNKSTLSVIKNPVAHSRTKHIEIRFHFIRDCYEKRLIEVIKIHTDHNVADLLTKGFDVTRFNFLVLAEEEATKPALIQDFNDIQARIEADRLLVARLQEEERETFTVEERAKFLYDTIAAQRRFLAQQRAAAIRSRPPKRTQLRNQMNLSKAISTQEITSRRYELILWRRLEDYIEILKEDNDQGNSKNNQQEWEDCIDELYEACGVCILELKDGTVIYMLVERSLMKSNAGNGSEKGLGVG